MQCCMTRLTPSHSHAQLTRPSPIFQGRGLGHVVVYIYPVFYIPSIHKLSAVVLGDILTYSSVRKTILKQMTGSAFMEIVHSQTNDKLSLNFFHGNCFYVPRTFALSNEISCISCCQAD